MVVDSTLQNWINGKDYLLDEKLSSEKCGTNLNINSGMNATVWKILYIEYSLSIYRQSGIGENVMVNV